MKSLGENASALPITLDDQGLVKVEDETIGRVEGLRFHVDHSADHADRKMLLAAAEKALPRLLGERVDRLLASDMAGVTLSRGAIRWGRQMLATTTARENTAMPVLEPSADVAKLPEAKRMALMEALESWLAAKLAPLEPLEKLQQAARATDTGSQGRALLLNLLSGHGFVTRERAGIEHLPKEIRPFLRKTGVTFGALDIFAPALLKPAPRQLLAALGTDRRPLEEAMLPVIPDRKSLPAGYRHAGSQAIRIDLAEKIFRKAHEARAAAQASGDAPKKRKGGARNARKFTLDLALPISIGLEQDNAVRLLGQAGFRVQRARPLAEGAYGPARPDLWEWRPARRQQPQSRPPVKPREGSAFAALADLVR